MRFIQKMDISLDLRTLSSFHKYFLWKLQSKLCRFRHAVDLTLHRYRAPKLTNFSVEFKFKPYLKLRINLWVLSIMSIKQLPSPLLKCKCLTMKTSMDSWDLAGIASLLQNLPHVETLVIDIVSPDYFALDFLDRCYDEVKHWKSKEIYFKSLLQHLKIVKIFGFGNVLHTKEVFISVVQFLLKNAKVQEKMVITKPRFMQN
ncbi:putative F-box/LRR-repeat protein At5g54820 [Quercus lobata]|uniref:putative F-box/LRR-repeat protein At5g54820 n=1 Tax=Quercus lobata TaxID=97700 RepID=UPI0012486CED|nr:putative F-box/LRR-repeat protein At5g54820 [Quercus lobata]